MDNPGPSADTQGDNMDNHVPSADTQGGRGDNLGQSADTQGGRDDNLRQSADTQGGRGDNQVQATDPQAGRMDQAVPLVFRIPIRDPSSESGYREADDAYNRLFEEFYSDCKEVVHKVPAVYFGKHSSCKKTKLEIDETETVYLDHKAESDTAGDKAEKGVADFIYGKLLQDLRAQKGPAFLIMNYKFNTFCNKPSVKIQDANRFIRIEDGECVDGEHDILIVHYKYGVIFIQVKSTQAGTDPNQTSANAIKQTEKDEKFFQENFVDLNLDISISSVISLPDINERDLREDDRRNCKERLSDFGLRRCLFKNHLQNETTEGDTWWNEITKDRKGFDSFEDYKRVIARYIGYKSTVEIPVVFHQKPLYKTPPDGRKFSDAVATMGNRYMSIVLTPQQIYILNTDLPRLVMHGNFGTGKTVLLILKVRRLLREGKEVCVITMSSSALREMLEESIKHNIDFESGDSHLLEIAQAHEESELSKIIIKCAETKRHVFIDEFPSFTKTDKTLKAAIKQFPNQLMFWCITGRERYMKLSATVSAMFDEEPYCEQSQPQCSHPVASSGPPSSRNQEISATGHALPPTQDNAPLTGSEDDGTNLAFSGESKSEAMPVQSGSGGQVRNPESSTAFSLQAIPQPTGHGFIRFFMSKILRCPPTVYSILPTMPEREKIIACYDKYKVIKALGTKKKLALHFHSLGLYTSETLKISQERPENFGLKWADIVVVDKTLELGDVENKTSYSALVDLRIPLVTSAVNNLDNEVLFAVKDHFKGFGRRELIVFGEKKVIANPVEEICMEGPEILHVDHTQHNAASQVCCDCENEIGNIIKKLDLHDRSEANSNKASSENVFTPRLELTVADVVIIDTRQEPKSMAHLFQRSGLRVVDKLEAEAVKMTDMFSQSEVMQIKPKMIAGLEKKVVFVVRSQKEKLVSGTRLKAIEDLAMLAYTRYTSQLIIITMDSSAKTN